MSVELLYTSAVQGLKQGSRGFCTVISTAGMPINLATRLEGLSAYRHIYPPNHPDAAKNPVNFSHLRINVGGRPVSILSRVADYGIDYSQRTNKLAHHVVIEAHEQTPAGPAWLMQSTSVLRSRWDGQCATPASGPTIPMQDQTGKICTTWKSLSGDAGWGGVVADTFASAIGKPLWIIYDLGQREQLLTLLNEAIALLPHEKRWSATFSTYATNVPPDADCKVRCVPAGSDDARLAPAMGKVIDLTKKQAVPTVTELVTAAREGIAFTPKPVPSAPRPMAVETPQVHSANRQSDVNDFELVEDDFEMKLKPIGPPSVTSSHLPPSPPPAVRSRPTPQPNYAQLAPDTPDSNSWMKWALIGASVTIVCLMIAIGGLVFSMKSKDVAQKEEKPAAPVEVQAAVVDPKTEARNNEPLPTNDAIEGKNDKGEAPNEGPGRTIPDPQGSEVTDKSSVPSNTTEAPSTDAAIEEKQEATPTTEESHASETTVADASQTRPLEKPKEQKIEIGRVDLYDLLTEGKVILNLTVATPFSRKEKMFYKDKTSPPVGLEVSLPYEWVSGRGSVNEEVEKITIIAIDPLTITIVQECKDKRVKGNVSTIRSEWSELKKDVANWKKKYPRLNIQFEDPKKAESFASFRKRLALWDEKYREFAKRIDDDQQALSKTSGPNQNQLQSVEDDFKQLNQINLRVKTICENLDGIANKEVIESAVVLYHSDASQPALPPGVEGRDPFRFRYRIESEGDVGEALSDEQHLRNGPQKPQPRSEVGKS